MDNLITIFNNTLSITNTKQDINGHYLHYLYIEGFSGYLINCYFEGYIHHEFINYYFTNIYLHNVNIDGLFYGSINACGIINHIEICSEIPKKYILGEYDIYQKENEEDEEE